jgi:hypothetical protein
LLEDFKIQTKFKKKTDDLSTDSGEKIVEDENEDQLTPS